MSLAELLERLQALGIRLELQGAELRVQAPKGLLTPEWQALLKRHKPELIAYLARQSVPQKAPLELSLFFFGTESSSGPGEKYSLLLQATKLAEELGFIGIWTPERHFHDLGGLFPNPALLGAALAMTTRRLKLRAGSVVLPLQDPIRVAEEWAVVDNLSQGRVELSFASGWHANDFALAPENYFERHQLMYQRLEQVKALWRGEALERQGPGQDQLSLRSFPRPLQPELPVWLTAIGNPESYRRIGARGAHLLTALLDQSPQELGAKIPIYHQALREAGHDPAAFKVAVFMHSFCGSELESVRQQVREPFKAYLAQTLNLLGNLSQSLGLGLNPESFSPQERETLLDFAFERYFEERSLMGDSRRCFERMQHFSDLGVNEIACLVDFGLPAQDVLESIERLGRLLQQSQQNLSDAD